MDWTESLGLVAGVLTTLAFLPQVAKTWKTRSARDFSLPTLMLLVAGSGLWAVYGVLRVAPSVWLANGTTAVLTGFILSIKLRRG